MTERGRRRIAAWLAFFACFAFIVATLDVAFAASSFLRSRGYLTSTVRTLFGVAGVLFAYVVFVGASVRRPIVWMRTAPAFALFFYAAIRLREQPGEQFHFIEYGVLFFFALRAAAIDTPPWLAYVIGFAAASLAGWCDEMLQDRSPVRVFDIEDVHMNMIAAALAAVICFLLFGRDLARLQLDGLRDQERRDDE